MGIFLGWMGIFLGWTGIILGFVGKIPGFFGIIPGWIGIIPGWIGIIRGWTGIIHGWMGIIRGFAPCRVGFFAGVSGRGGFGAGLAAGSFSHAGNDRVLKSASAAAQNPAGRQTGAAPVILGLALFPGGD